MEAADLPAGLHLSTTANWNQLADDWRVFLQKPHLAFVAERTTRPVGSVACARYGGLDWVAMMLVAPEERSAGIGTRLMRHVLEAIEGSPCVGLDATPLGEPLYLRHGFTTHSKLTRTKCVIEESQFEPFAGKARPITNGDLSSVLALDRQLFGADRSALLLSLLARAPECGWIASDLSAYCVGRPGRLFYQLGPVVAENRDAARSVVSACLAQLPGRVFAIDAPLHDSAWLAWLASVGFAAERPFTRMFLKGHSAPGNPTLQFAITGPEFA